MKILFSVWKLFYLFLVPITFLLALVLFFPFLVLSGIELVRVFAGLARKNGIHILKTSIEQIPLGRTQREIVTAEFIASQEEYYGFRKFCNDKGIWFLRPIWSALDANKWVYSVVPANKRSTDNG